MQENYQITYPIYPHLNLTVYRYALVTYSRRTPTEELRSNRSRMTTEMSKSAVRYGSNTGAQRCEYGVRRIYRQNVGKSPGRDTDCYGSTRFNTERHESGRLYCECTTVCYGISTG